jgi:hypothetical protein
MKIETKYDIGQEVWYICPVKPVNAIPIQGQIRAVDITKTDDEHFEDYYVHGLASSIDWDRIYPTKEACEQAIKEMEE